MSTRKSTVVKTCRLLNQKVFRITPILCLVTLFQFNQLPAGQEDSSPDSLEVPQDSVEPASESVAQRLRVNLDGGLFVPVGKWSEGFDPGVSVGAGLDLPLREGIDIGGRFSRFVLSRDDQARFSWFSMEAQVTLDLPVEIHPVIPFVVGRAGLLRAAVEVGEGREDEWDLLAGTGGGIRVPISDDYHVLGMAMWRRVLGEGQGFHFSGGLSFYPFR